MADKKLQMKEYNTSSTDWDSLLPVTNLAYVNGVSSSARTFLGTPSTHNLRQMVVDTGTGALVFAEYPVITASVLNSSTISDARYLSIIDTTAGVYSGRLRIISTSEALTGDVRLDVDLNNGNRILQLDGSLYVKTASVTLLGRSGGSELLLPSGTLAFSGTGNAYTVSNGGYLIASNNAPSANEGYVLQVVGGTPSWVAAGSISGSVAITGALEISSNLTVKGNTTLTTSLNGVVIATAGVLSARSASLVNEVTGTLPVGRGGSGATSLTGILVGNGASAFTAVTAPSGTIVGTTDTQVLSNKTFNLSQNTMTGSLAQFNTALIGADFASLAGVETLTNKTIDLGNNILTGSSAQLNTAVGGTLLTENSTNIGITSKTFNDNGITFQDNGDNSRKMQFQLSAITAGTTVSITIPDIVSGTMLTTNNTATLTNKTINGNNNTLTNIDLTTAVTGTLPVANGGTGVTSKTGTGNVVLSANQVLTGVMTASTINATTLTLTNALSESEGGTGESSYTSGQILIGNSSGGLTKAFISGTTNEISVTTASGAITIGLPNNTVISGLMSSSTAFVSGRLTASSLNVTGTAIIGTVQGPTGFSDGTVGNPGINFSSDTDTGIYRVGSGNLALVSNGSAVVSVDTAGFNLETGQYLVLNGLVYGTNVNTVPYANQRILRIAGTGGIGTSYTVGTDGSSRRIKADIADFEFDTENFLKLEPRTYKFKKDIEYNGTNAKSTIGFIAEEAKDLGLIHLYQEDEQGIPDYFAYDRLPIYLMKVIKEQQEQIKSLTTRIEALEG